MKRIRLQVGDEVVDRAALDDEPGGRAVVDQVQHVLDVPVGAQQQRLGGAARAQGVELLAGQAVQPGQPVGAR
jgi:hypothetical protein